MLSGMEVELETGGDFANAISPMKESSSVGSGIPVEVSFGIVDGVERPGDFANAIALIRESSNAKDGWAYVDDPEGNVDCDAVVGRGEFEFALATVGADCHEDKTVSLLGAA